MEQRTSWGRRTRLGLTGGATLLAAWGALPVTPTNDASAASRNVQREAQVELGRRLFLDPVASRGGEFSCADCHEPEHGFSDPRPLSVDENGTTARHSQPVTDLAGAGFHWDGEFDTVRQLLVARLHTAQAAIEQTADLMDGRFAMAQESSSAVNETLFRQKRPNLTPPYYGAIKGPVTPTSRPPVVARLELDGRYDEGFKRAYGSTTIQPERVVDAVAMYLETLRTTESPYDRHRRGDKRAMDAPAQRGLALFEGKAGCAECHTTQGDSGHLLSDGVFHDTGVAFRDASTSWVTRPVPAIEYQRAASDLGRAGQTFQIDQTGRFKTPSLRDVARRPPYMHDGSFASLDEVVDYYDQGGTAHDGLDTKIAPLGLSATERSDLVAFLHALTGDERAGLGDLPAYRAKSTRVRVLDLEGGPVAGLRVNVVPAGDRLRGVDQLPEPFARTTNEHGWVEFPFPASTQVRLTADGYEIGMTRLLPDWLRKHRVVATPHDTVSVLVRRSNEQVPLPESIRVRPRNVPAGHTTDAQITLTRVRRIDRDRSLYSVDRGLAAGQLGRWMPSSQVVRMITDIEGQPARTFDVDLAGGQTSPFDLRLDTIAPRPTTSTPGNRRRGRPGGGTLPDDRKGKDGRPGRDSARDDVGGSGAKER